MEVLLIMEVDFFSFLLLGLASFRLTRLIVFDVITERIRMFFLEEMIEENDNEKDTVYVVPRGKGLRRFIGELISCYWCTGIWVSGFLVASLGLFPSFTMWLLVILSVAALASLIETLVQRLY